MITEEQQEQASLYVVGALPPDEHSVFEAEVRGNGELRDLVRSLQHTTGLLAASCAPAKPPAGLRDKVLGAIDARKASRGESKALPKSPLPKPLPGFLFHGGEDSRGWKELPIRGAWLKFLSIDRERGYAVLLGRLEPGVRYPAHQHEGGEELYILTGDLHIGDRRLVAGDFHHADSGTSHPVNYSIDGCTLIAVLPAEHELVQFAMA
jgi:anti-sigma factor ChrR (cupin superfamily)